MHADQKFIEALVENNHTLLDELFSIYAPRITKMIIANGGSISDAEDIFQEALIKIHSRAVKGFVLTCPFDAFIYIVCKNIWANQLKKIKNTKVTFVDTSGYNIGEDVFENEKLLEIGNSRRELFNKKLDELGQSCKELLQLIWSGKPQEEVAEMMQTSYGYIRKRKSICMGKLTLLVQQSSEFKDLLWP